MSKTSRPIYGPGFVRMRNRLGSKRMEEIRQDVLRGQKAARSDVLGEDVDKPVVRDRSSYKDYPAPKGRKK
jgi:hypothetical protein